MNGDPIKDPQPRVPALGRVATVVSMNGDPIKDPQSVSDSNEFGS